VVNSFAQEWHNGEGLVVMANITPEGARADALALARNDALEQAGIEIRGTTARHIIETTGADTYDQFARFTRTVTRGVITSEEILFDDQVKIGDVWHYKVALRAEVTMQVGEPDPSFQVELTLNLEVYHHNETMTMTLSATHDCYITIFNLTPDDSIRVVVPNRYYSQTHLTGGDTLLIPPTDAGWELPVWKSTDAESEPGAILVVATRDDIPFRPQAAVIRDDLLSMGDALTALGRWLIDIPADRRTEDISHYKIVR
jgi:hypothetical protein